MIVSQGTLRDVASKPFPAPLVRVALPMSILRRLGEAGHRANHPAEWRTPTYVLHLVGVRTQQRPAVGRAVTIRAAT